MNMKILLPILLTAMLVLVLEGVSAAISFDNCVDNSTLDASVDLDDDTINPGDDISVKVDVENSGNIDIDNIEMELYFQKAGGTSKLEDDSEDNIEETEDFDLDEGDDDSFDYSWTPNQNFDDGDEYDLIVKLKGKEHGNSSNVFCAWNYDETVQFNKEKYKLDVYKTALTPTSVQCSRNVNAKIGLKNIGQKDIDDAELTISSSELSVEKLITFEELSSDPDDDDNAIEKTASFTVPEDVAAGTYTIDFNLAYRDGKETEFTSADLEVKKCAVVEEEEAPVAEEPTTVIVQPTTPAATAETTATAATIPPLIVDEKPAFYKSLVFWVISLEVIVVLVGIILIAKWVKG